MDDILERERDVENSRLRVSGAGSGMMIMTMMSSPSAVRLICGHTSNSSSKPLNISPFG